LPFVDYNYLPVVLFVFQAEIEMPFIGRTVRNSIKEERKKKIVLRPTLYV